MRPHCGSICLTTSLLGIVLTACATSYSKTITVDDDAPADFNNIQAAINYAADGDIVEVGDGTYTGPGNRDIDLLGKEITLRSENGPYKCIIDCAGSAQDHHRGFKIHNGESFDTFIEGFTIQGGYVDGEWPDFGGGGIFIHLSHPTISRCIIRQNKAAYGGGIFCCLAVPVIMQTTFADNTATQNGGAMFCIKSNADLYKATITNNSAAAWGGGIMDDNANSIINESTFSNNSAEWGGALCSIDGDTHIEDCDLNNNRATGYGGAVFISTTRGRVATIHNSRFFENIAKSGGAVCCTLETASITNSHFYDNVAAEFGGAVYLENSNAAVRRSLIENNSAAAKGGGIAIYKGAPKLDDCDFTENTSRSGAAVSSISANTTVSNSDLTANKADLFGGGFFSWYSTGDLLSNCTISQNEGESGGGAAAFEGILRVADCSMHDNSVPMHGGALYVWEISHAPVTNSTFTLNRAYKGGGIYSSSSCPTISDCNISNNNAIDDGGAVFFSRDSGESPALINCILSDNSAFDAGAIAIASAALSIKDCIITGNQAEYGGAIDVDDPNATTPAGTTQITNCIISDNSAVVSGGAIVVGNTAVHIFDSDMMHNSARDGGALFFHDYNAPPNADLSKVVNCSIMHNAARDCGGAIFGQYSNPTILNSVLALNSAEWGGGVYFYETGGIVDSCAITQNTADAIAGGIFIDGGAPTIADTEVTANRSFESVGGMNCYETGATLKGCLVAGNLTVGGCVGGINFRNAAVGPPSPTVTNCTITENMADCSGGIQVDYTRPIFTNTIIYHNTATDFCPNIRLMGIPDHKPFAFCDLEATLSGAYVGPGNINCDPLFAAAGHWDDNGTPTYRRDDFWVAGDSRLKSEAGRYDPNTQNWVIDEVTSLCIDAGSPMSPVGSEPFPNGGVANMGAYGATMQASKSYFQRPPCRVILAGDLNGDCVIDAKDFALMAGNWNAEGSP